MKTIASILLVFVLASGFAPAFPKASNWTLTFKYSVIHIVEGYDHISKLVIYEDGQSYWRVELKRKNLFLIQ